MYQKCTLLLIATLLSMFSDINYTRAMDWPQPPEKPHSFLPIPAKTQEQLRAKRLKLAVQSGNLQEIMQNVNAQNVNLQDSRGFTPLYYARTAPAAALLIFNGANTQVRNNAGLTPLHQAAALNDLDVVRLLVEPARYPIDFQQISIFWDIITDCPEENCPHREKAKQAKLPVSEVNRYLASNAQRIAIPANVSDAQLGTPTPLWYAILYNAQPVAEYLLERINANPEMVLPVLNEVEAGTLRSLAHIAATPALINLLARYKFPLNMEERYGYTPLEAAAANNRDDLVQALVANNALIGGPLNNPRPTNDPRRQKVIDALKRIYQHANPLLYALLTGNFDDAKKILEGAQITSVQTTGLSGFFGRLTGRQQTEAERLLTTPVGNLTALRAAIGQRSRPLTALLITHGALANTNATHIRELEQLARNVSSPEVISLLLAMTTTQDDTMRRRIAQRIVNEYLQERTPVTDLETGTTAINVGEEQEVDQPQEPVRLSYQHALEQIPLHVPSASSSFDSFGGGSQRD